MPGLVNGREYDFASIEAKFNNLTFFILAISYENPREIGKLFGNSRRKRARTTGREDPSGSFEMDKKEATRLVTALADEFGGYYETNAVFEIVVTYGDANQGVTTDKLTDVMLMNVGNDHSDGTDALTETFDIDIGKVNLDGAEAFAS